MTGFFYNKNDSLTIRKGGTMKIIPSNDPSIIKFTMNLAKILVICDTGFSLPDDCLPIFIARPEKEIFIYSTLLAYFDLIPLIGEPKPFSFFVGKKIILREIRGYDRVMQLVDKQYNTLELRMKPDIENILRRKKLNRIKVRMKNKRNFNSDKDLANKINKQSTL